MRTLLIALLLVTSIGHTKSEVFSSFELVSPDQITLKAVAQHFGIEHRRGSSYELIVPTSQVALLRKVAPDVRLLVADTAKAAEKRLRSFAVNFKSTDQRYHSFSDVQTWMKAHESSHPDFVKVIQYGASKKGHSLLAIELGSGEAEKPALMITAATHGDELITTEVILGLVDQLVAGYGKDERLTAIVKNHNLYFVPVLNPDGFTSVVRYDGSADPNRSYPYPQNENVKPTPSIAGIIQLFNTIHPVASLDFHAYGELVMYPWAYTHSPVDKTHKQKFDQVTSKMAATNGYTYGPISEVIYIAPGSSADYYYWKAGTAGIAVEIGVEKIPEPSEIPVLVGSQAESTWRFAEAF